VAQQSAALPEPAPPVEVPPAEPASAEPELVLAIAPMEELPRESTPLPVEERDLPEEQEYKHKGFVLSADLGSMGCTRDVCSSSGHKAQPGVRLNGFLGFNIKGRVELGLLGGWGRMGTGVEERTSVLGLYGVSPGQNGLVAQGLGLTGADLLADDATLTAGSLAPVLRVHFAKTGRVAAFVGAGVGGTVFRARYRGTFHDEFKLGFIGLELPMHGGAMYYVNKRVAIGGTVEYRWTHWLALRVQHPQRDLIAPLSAVKATAESNGLEFSPQLPHMWTASLSLRLTI
jgi:opacity protein-like surface antigen